MRTISALFLLATLPLGAWAGFDEGMRAFERKDYATALAEWRPLAETGMVEAQYNLGLLYFNGHGVAVDVAEALSWYRLAAEQGYARAQYRCGEIYEAGHGVDTDLVQAHFWFTLASSQKYLDSKKRKRRVARRMTPEEIAQADMLARHWKRDHAGAD